MAMSMGGGGASAPQMNVTPLIDVLLVLIIIFMLIVVQSKDKGFKTEIPQPPPNDVSTPPQQAHTIVVQVKGTNADEAPNLEINQQPVSWPDLKTRLQDIFKARAEKVAFIQGDGEVNFEYVAYVIDTAREAGVERVGLLPKDMMARR